MILSTRILKKRIFIIGPAMLFLIACASYQTKVSNFRTELKENRPEEAAKKIKEKAEKESDDQVVYLLEYATALQLAGNYEESTKAFLKAEDQADIKDYHSISRVTGALLTSQNMIQYKGENYEKVLINAMLAINYLMMGNLDDARVEARKLNDKLYKFRYEGKKNYDQNPFAFYLSALIEEAQRDWDTAYIDFKKTYDLNPNIEYLKEDLIRAGLAARRDEDVQMWRKKWPNIKPASLKDMGEVVLIYQEGWGPQKRPNPSYPRIPKLYPINSHTQMAKLEVETGPSERSQEVMNVTQVATKTLSDDYASIIGLNVAGIGTKAVVADQIRQKNKLLGELAWIGMNIADQADLRQWISLPSSFQIVKIRLKPGTYRIRAVGLSGSGNPTDESSPWWNVTVKARQKSFLNWRSLR